jgi:nucleoside 2-deoxyribosyltransferase
MIERVIYLAGPITGLSYGEARHGWREYFPTLLPPHIHCSSPMRGKDHLAGIEVIAGRNDAYKGNPMTSGKGITTRDRNDVRTCDLMVANFLGAPAGSLGTAIEFGWADAWRKPIITVMEPEGNPHDHLMITEIGGYIVHTLEHAARLATLILTPGV